MALYPGEFAEVNAGASCGVRTWPPNAEVIWYQQVDRPSAVARWRSSGLAMLFAVPTFFRSAVNSEIVVGIVVMPALAKSFLFTVVTRNDESNGIPIRSLFAMNVSIWGMSDLRLAALKYLFSG